MNDEENFWGMRYGRRGNMMRGRNCMGYGRMNFMGNGRGSNIGYGRRNFMGNGAGFGPRIKSAILEELQNKTLSTDEIKSAIENMITGWFGQYNDVLETQLKWLEYNGFIKKTSDNRYEITEYGKKWLNE